MVVEQQLPPGVRDLNLAGQAEALRQSAMASNDPVTLVQLGAVLQEMGDAQSAEFAYQSALDADPGNVPARVGLALVPVTADPAKLERAAAALDDLAGAEPQSQLVSFNQGWVALYLKDVAAARAAFGRTVALGADTRLGRTARTLRTAMGSVRFQPPAGP
jgi:tetratricopeptide (TPR) repeat protein